MLELHWSAAEAVKQERLDGTESSQVELPDGRLPLRDGSGVVARESAESKRSKEGEVAEKEFNPFAPAVAP